MHTFGILDTGAPKTFRYIHAAIKKGAVPRSRIGLLLCDNPKTPVLDAAAELGVPHAYLPGKKESRDRWARDAFLKAGVETILLIGYLPKVGAPLLEAFPERIFNIHGGPLPRFGGKGMMNELTQQAVLDAG